MNEEQITTYNLPVGKFADQNGSVIYKYKSVTNNSDGYWLIERHNHKSMHTKYVPIENPKGGYITWAYIVTPIDKPEKKHIDQAICLLRKASKEGFIDGLCFLENLTTLKELLRAHGKK